MRQRQRQADRYKNRNRKRERETKTVTQIDKQTETGKQTDRKMDRFTERQFLQYLSLSRIYR